MSSTYIINYTDPEAGSFNINGFASNGLNFPTSSTLSSAAIAANTTLELVGRGRPLYGERFHENMVHMLENFSGASTPLSPISGQLWFTRQTYIFTTAGASGYWRWNDATSLWIDLAVGVLADEVQSAGTAPVIVDGGFWFDSTNSILNLGIDDGLHPLAPTWLPRALEDISAAAIGDPNAAGYTPNKVLKVFDGLIWKNATGVFVSAVAPTTPTDGDLWFDTTALGMRIWHNSTWNDVGGAHVSSAGDRITGVIDFGPVLPAPGVLFLFEGAGDDTVAPDVRMLGNGLLTTETDFYINVDDNNSSAGIFQVGKGTQTSAGATPLFSVLNDGQIRAGVASYETLAVTNDQNLTNTKFVVDADLAVIAAQLITDTAQDVLISANTGGVAANVITLATKVDTTGDTMTGILTLSGAPIGALDAATKDYVDTAVSGGGADGVITSAAWTAATRDLTLSPTIAPAIVVNLAHNHPTSQIDLISPLGTVFRDLVGVGPDYNLSFLDNLMQRFYEDGNRSNAPAERQVINVTVAQSDFTFDELEYSAGYNSLDVFVNGVKFYSDERAHQTIVMNTGIAVTESSPTGLPSDATVYDIDVAVDGAGATTITAAGTALQTVSDIVTVLNGSLVGAFAEWHHPTSSIRIYSDTTGNTSEIDIVDGSGADPLLSNLAAQVGAGLPVFVVLGGINPPAAGPVTQITQDLGYKETDDLFAELTYGTTTASISFTANLTPGDKIEVISRQHAPL